ncbi:unnamed protein product, partial [Polarella glacialis]
RGTFLDFTDGLCLRSKLSKRWGRAKTDSFLQTPDDSAEDYEPGLLSAAHDASSELRRADFGVGESGSSTEIQAFSSAGRASQTTTPLRPGLVDSEELRHGQQRQQTRISSHRRAHSGSALAQPRTTVMLRNLPNNYTRSMLLTMLDKEGYFGRYDFLYLPFDFNRNANLGYAFVNLVDAETASLFWQAFDGFERWTLPTVKVCQVRWSGPIQGLQAHVERYRNSPVMHKHVPDEYKPVMFADGESQAPLSASVGYPGCTIYKCLGQFIQACTDVACFSRCVRRA